MSLSPLVAAAAFLFGLLLVLGIGHLSKARARATALHEPTATPVVPGRFRLIEVDNAPDDLPPQTPVKGVLVRSIPGPDRPDYWIARLDRPLRWLDEGTERVIDHLVLAARLQGQSIDAGVEPLMVGVAYVVDPTLLSDAALTFAKIRYVAIATIDRS